MELIIFKIILCSSLLIGLYYIFLEKEKMHQFNRFFLISSLLFSLVAPFVSIKTEIPKSVSNPKILFEETTQQVLNLTSKEETFSWIYLIGIIYGTITLILLTKIIVSVIKIKKIKGKKIAYQSVNIIITKQQLPPFTFWKTIYLSENYFVNNKIDERVFLHEKSHLEQKHSMDLLFIEFLKAIMWFNPALYFYKKAIITNHEFLADETVLKSNFNVKEYQTLILDEIISSQNYSLTHTFNFNNTKKRFIMMNRKKSNLTGIKKIISIPVLIIAFGLFVQKTYANAPVTQITKHIQPQKTQNIPSPSIQERLDEEKQLIENKEVKYTNDEKEILDTIRPNHKTHTKEEAQSIQGNPAENPENNANFVQAEYPLGMNVLRNEVAQNFNTKNIEGIKKGVLKSTAFISIDKEGKIKTVSVTGNNEAMNTELGRTILAVTKDTPWKPATQDGQPVDTRFTLPVTMSFE
ncbi:M56 family metallopeptidase [Chryseobacterium oryctis]|uniref:M56 family metallopeptidase n=1 Tax=Chryseobacterium oryctis TaxID=2952618 RepID=A0ABT3HLY2_9FLAO|nr:M56 family metallopeptidase [Chryseobacterium oryctis]MCW3160802.1 M56 family metallopeptidase [Chryseobacterium oryctis]